MAADEKPRLVLGNVDDLVTREGFAAFFKQLTGRDADPKALDEAMAEIAAAEAALSK